MFLASWVLVRCFGESEVPANMKYAIIFSCLVACATGEGIRFSYDDGAANGPSNWGTYPGSALCGNGTRQSPIDIVRSTATQRTFPTLSFSGATNETEWTISNVGFNVQAFSRQDIFMRGGPLNATKRYKVSYIEFYFGNTTFAASEHSFDGGSRTTGELHVMTYDSEFDAFSTAAASNRPDAVSIFGVLFQAQSGQTYDAGITSLIESASNLTYIFSRYTGPLDFSRMYTPVDTQQYYHYMGSLTIPTCNEVASWIVANRVQNVSPTLINRLTSLKTGRNAAAPGNDLFGNARPIQQPNGRTVYRSFTQPSSISTLASVNIFTLVATFLVFLALN